MSEGQTNIWTVGHSTLTIGDFLEMLSSNGIRALADVRRFPASRRHPQFNQDELRESLAAAGIEYLHLAGTWRTTAGASGLTKHRLAQPIFSWLRRSHGDGRFSRRNRATAPVRAGQTDGDNVRRGGVVAMPPSLIADYLKASAVNVIHINSTARNTVHPYTSAAQINDGQLSYSEPPDFAPL